MKKVLFIIILFFVLFNCQNEKSVYSYIDTFPKYYINKDSLRIIEIDSNNIKLYNFSDSTEIRLKEEFLLPVFKNFDSLTLSIDSIGYKRININTDKLVDLKSSEFWTLNYNNLQEWYSFRENMEGVENRNTYKYNEYSYYSNTNNQDTVFHHAMIYRSSLYFDKFYFTEFGSLGIMTALFSPVSSDSIRVDLLKSFDKTLHFPALYLTRYNSQKKASHIGNWQLVNKSKCDDAHLFTGNNLIVKTDSLFFLNNKKLLSKASYRLGLDSKFYESLYPKNYLDIDLFWNAKLLNQTSSSLKLIINYNGYYCREMDTLIYKRVNQK